MIPVNGASSSTLAITSKLQEFHGLENRGGLHQETILRFKDEEGQDSTEVAHLLARETLQEGEEVRDLTSEEKVGRGLEGENLWQARGSEQKGS